MKAVRRTVWYALVAAVAAASAQDAPPPSSADRVGRMLDKAAALLAQGEADKALATVTKARAELGDEAPWLTVRSFMLEGRIQATQGEWDSAVRAFNQIVEAYSEWPEYADALYSVGEARARQQRYPLARAAWEKLITECPHSWARLRAERQLVVLDLNDNDLETAGKRVDAYVKAFPWAEDVPWLLGRLGRKLADEGRPQEALGRLEQLCKAYPGTQAAYDARRPMVEAHRALKQYDQATALLEEVVGRNPEMFVTADATALHADILVEKGEWQKAVELLGDLARRYAGTFVAIRSMRRQADILADHDDIDGAVQRLETIREAFGAPYWQVQTLGALFDLLNEHQRYDAAEDAAAALVALTEGTPAAASALLEMARVQRAAGRKKAARRSVELVLQTYKGAPVVPWAQALLHDWDEQDREP